MLSQKNILILTSKTGGGHVSLAEALCDLIKNDAQAGAGENDKDTKDAKAPAITVVDPQPGFFHLHYRLVSRYALWLWAAEFQFFDVPCRAQLAHRVFTHLVRRQINSLLENVRPDLIITTYPFLTYEVMRTLEQRCRWRGIAAETGVRQCHFQLRLLQLGLRHQRTGQCFRRIHDAGKPVFSLLDLRFGLVERCRTADARQPFLSSAVAPGNTR